MDQQKIVVVLLLITIILSVVTVILTLGVNLSELTSGKDVGLADTQNVPAQESSNIALTVLPSG